LIIQPNYLRPEIEEYGIDHVLDLLTTFRLPISHLQKQALGQGSLDHYFDQFGATNNQDERGREMSIEELRVDSHDSYFPAFLNMASSNILLLLARQKSEAHSLNR
jgi:hypothetical protein